MLPVAPGSSATSGLRSAGASLLVIPGVLALLGAIGLTPATGQQPTPRTFEAIGAELAGVSGSSSTWGDFDSDGDLDLVVTEKDADGSPTATIYENNRAIAS